MHIQSKQINMLINLLNNILLNIILTPFFLNYKY